MSAAPPNHNPAPQHSAPVVQIRPTPAAGPHTMTPEHQHLLERIAAALEELARPSIVRRPTVQRYGAGWVAGDDIDIGVVGHGPSPRGACAAYDTAFRRSAEGGSAVRMGLVKPVPCQACLSLGDSEAAAAVRVLQSKGITPDQAAALMKSEAAWKREGAEP
ncbi:MAG TPA: hypothetical protein PKC43_06385 [Phycisphaerales bacterium]|nr:hypothetical protein [Phycisphaerales bacterium]HMP37060.1 hypothetical protein [Phycisphaerales bacterium]